MATHRHLRVAFLPGVRVQLKVLKPKDYTDSPRTLGEHLKKRRRQLGLYQREAAKGLKVDHFTYINWEKGHTEPYAILTQRLSPSSDTTHPQRRAPSQREFGSSVSC